MATRLTYAQLEAAWIAGGGSSTLAPLMAAIAEAESGGNPDATNPTDNGGRQTSWGLWQISNGDHSEPAPNWNDPVENARLAVGKLHSQGLGAWGTYTSGAYRQFLQGSVPPSASLPGGGASDASSGATIKNAGLFGIPGPQDVVPSKTDLSGLITGVVNFLANTQAAINGLMIMLVFLLNPANWVRLVAGIVGAVALVTGLVFVVRAA